MKSRMFLVFVFLLALGIAPLVLAQDPNPTGSPLPTPTFTPTPGPGPGPLPEPGDTAMLQVLLMKLIGGGLASVVVYAFLAKDIGKAVIDVVVEGLTALGIGLTWGEVARYVAVVLAAMVSMTAFAVALAFGFVENPGSAAAWINLVLWMMGVGFTGSQVLHARLKPRADEL